LNPQVWIVGLTIAIVASIETLLCIEAADRMDVHKRYTDTNVELHNIGNILSLLVDQTKYNQKCQRLFTVYFY
jgi:MFS superfamily sulfate permease-like transporter